MGRSRARHTPGCPFRYLVRLLCGSFVMRACGESVARIRRFSRTGRFQQYQHKPVLEEMAEVLLVERLYDPQARVWQVPSLLEED
jgi:hypothetical protein